MKKELIMGLTGLFLIIFAFVMYSGYCFVLIGPPAQTQQALCESSFLFLSLGIILIIVGLISYLKRRK